MYAECFSGPPWNQPVSRTEATERWKKHISMSSFYCLVAEIDNKIIGASWFNVMSPEELKEERGEEILNFVTSKHQGRKILWIRETIVDPKFKNQGVAKSIKSEIMSHIRANLPQSLLLTRMRDDNVGIIKVNEKIGFKRTGIKIKSLSNRDINHEYWYMDID
jgi:RimJ/RimL family protein N-acetyltransferase